MAVAWHGFPRYSGDVDFFVRPSPENAARIMSAIGDFGLGSLGLGVDDFSTNDQILQLGYPPNRIDVITSISGVSFEEAWAARVCGTIEGLPIQLIGREELLKNKDATGRGKDQIDALELRKITPKK